MMLWYQVRMTWLSGGNDNAAAEMAAMIASADGSLLKSQEFRDIAVTPTSAQFTLCASSVSDAYIQALVTLNRTAAVAGVVPSPLTGLHIEAAA